MSRIVPNKIPLYVTPFVNTGATSMDVVMFKSQKWRQHRLWWCSVDWFSMKSTYLLLLLISKVIASLFAPLPDTKSDLIFFLLYTAGSNSRTYHKDTYNSLIGNFKACKYYAVNAKLPTTTKNTQLFLLHVNIRSVHKNFKIHSKEVLNSLAF